MAMNLEQLAVVNSFVGKYASIVQEIYFRYCEDFLGDDVITVDNKDVALGILGNIDTAWGIGESAVEICDVMGISKTGIGIRGLLSQIEEECQRKTHTDMGLSTINYQLRMFLRKC